MLLAPPADWRLTLGVRSKTSQISAAKWIWISTTKPQAKMGKRFPNDIHLGKKGRHLCDSWSREGTGDGGFFSRELKIRVPHFFLILREVDRSNARS